MRDREHWARFLELVMAYRAWLALGYQERWKRRQRAKQ